MKITSMMDAIAANQRMLKYLKENHPANLERDKEDGAEYVWELNRANDPFHADGLGKTRHSEEQDD